MPHHVPIPLAAQELQQLDALLEKLGVDPRVNSDHGVPSAGQFEIISAIMTIRSKAIKQLQEHPHDKIL